MSFSNSKEGLYKEGLQSTIKMGKTIIIDGKKIAQKVKQELKETLKQIPFTVGLGIIIVGDRPDSKMYVRMKKRECIKIGIENFDVHLDENVPEQDIITHIHSMNNNSNIHAILVQLPLPKHINERNVLSEIVVHKDVDGFHTTNVGNLTLNHNYIAPCTPTGCLQLLEEYNISLQGKHIVVIGRSNIVGLPLALLCLHKNATVTICHSYTKNIGEHCRKADILFVGCGKPKCITKDLIKEGAVLVDVGINKVQDAKSKKGYTLVGDIDFDDVVDRAGAITPVPGGVGPMTIAMLLQKTVQLAENLCMRLSP